jgi:molecular chaperone GrpE
MAQKKKIVIEDENEQTAKDDESPLEATGSVADEPTEDGPSEDFEAQLDAARAEAKEYHDRLLRMAAELDNYKKRSARDLDDMRKYATENLIRQLLTVVDNLERAIESADLENGKAQGVVDGVVMTLKEIMKILEKHHVKPIEALGEPFDPAFHQAMSQEERADQPSNTVVQEFQKGYLIHDRLLRPAMVVVSKAVNDAQMNENKINTNA